MRHEMCFLGCWMKCNVCTKHSCVHVAWQIWNAGCLLGCMFLFGNFFCSRGNKVVLFHFSFCALLLWRNCKPLYISKRKVFVLLQIYITSESPVWNKNDCQYSLVPLLIWFRALVCVCSRHLDWFCFETSVCCVLKEFGGNVDKDMERFHYLNSPFVSRFVRFHPIDWNKHISMRAGLLGCPYKGEIQSQDGSDLCCDQGGSNESLLGTLKRHWYALFLLQSNNDPETSLSRTVSNGLHAYQRRHPMQ